MASMDELDKFIYKFRSLWTSGSNAKLEVNAENGIARTSLHVSVKLPGSNDVTRVNNHSCQKGGSPSRQRRRVRREAERKAKEALSEKTGGSVVDKTNNVNEVTEMSETMFQVKVEGQEEVENYDVIEAIEENFGAALTAKNVSADHPCRNLVYNYWKKEPLENNNGEKINGFTINILVRSKKEALDVINEWKVPNNFDDLASRNSIGGRRQVQMKEVEKIIH